MRAIAAKWTLALASSAVSAAAQSTTLLVHVHAEGNAVVGLYERDATRWQYRARATVEGPATHSFQNVRPGYYRVVVRGVVRGECELRIQLGADSANCHVGDPAAVAERRRAADAELQRRRADVRAENLRLAAVRRRIADSVEAVRAGDRARELERAAAQRRTRARPTPPTTTRCELGGATRLLIGGWSVRLRGRTIPIRNFPGATALQRRTWERILNDTGLRRGESLTAAEVCELLW